MMMLEVTSTFEHTRKGMRWAEGRHCSCRGPGGRKGQALPSKQEETRRASRQLVMTITMTDDCIDCATVTK